MVEAARPDARRTRAGRGADRADVRARRLAAAGAGRREPDGAAVRGAFENSMTSVDSIKTERRPPARRGRIVAADVRRRKATSCHNPPPYVGGYLRAGP